MGRRTATVITAVVAVVVVVSIVAVAVVASVGGKTDGVSAFNACINQHRFFVLTRQESGGRLIDTIRDRARMNVVGKLAVLPTPRAAVSFDGTLPLTESSAVNGRMVLLTTGDNRRDTDAIQLCGVPAFPPA